MTANTANLYGLVAEFATSRQLLDAVHSTRAAGYRRIDALTPFAVEGLAEALEVGDNKLPLIVFIGGLIGGLLAFGLQYWAWVIDYPLNVGGRPLNSWQTFIIPTFEITILAAAVTAVVAALARNRLPQPYHPVFNTPYFRGSQDRFYLAIEVEGDHFDPRAVRRFLEGLQPLAVYEVEQ